MLSDFDSGVFHLQRLHANRGNQLFEKQNKKRISGQGSVVPEAPNVSYKRLLSIFHDDSYHIVLLTQWTPDTCQNRSREAVHSLTNFLIPEDLDLMKLNLTWPFMVIS